MANYKCIALIQDDTKFTNQSSGLVAAAQTALQSVCVCVCVCVPEWNHLLTLRGLQHPETTLTGWG